MVASYPSLRDERGSGWEGRWVRASQELRVGLVFRAAVGVSSAVVSLVCDNFLGASILSSVSSVPHMALISTHKSHPTKLPV